MTLISIQFLKTRTPLILGGRKLWKGYLHPSLHIYLPCYPNFFPHLLKISNLHLFCLISLEVVNIDNRKLHLEFEGFLKSFIFTLR